MKRKLIDASRLQSLLYLRHMRSDSKFPYCPAHQHPQYWKGRK